MRKKYAADTANTPLDEQAEAETITQNKAANASDASPASSASSASSVKAEKGGGISAVKAYRVVTTRRPFWNGSAQLQNAVFEADPSHPAIAAMLDRVWIVEV